MRTAVALLMGTAALALVGKGADRTTASFTQRALVGSHCFLGFRPAAAGWTSIEATEDLVTWTPIACVVTTNGVTEFVDENAVARPRRFYRLKHPGVTVEEAEARWAVDGKGDYQFQLQHVRSHTRPYVLSATVTVVDGQKSLTHVEGDGQPLEQPEAVDFPDVDELFAALYHAEQVGCWRVAVGYDEAAGYPHWCVRERLIEAFPGGKATDWFRLTQLTRLPRGNGIDSNATRDFGNPMEVAPASWSEAAVRRASSR